MVKRKNHEWYLFEIYEIKTIEEWDEVDFKIDGCKPIQIVPELNIAVFKYTTKNELHRPLSYLTSTDQYCDRIKSDTD